MSNFERKPLKSWRKALGRILGAIVILFMSPLPDAFASGSGVTYHGRLLKPDGRPVSASNVQFRIQIRTASDSDCLLYQEIQTKDLSQSEGIFAITIGDGTADEPNTEPFSLSEAFQNKEDLTLPAGKCAVSPSVAISPTTPRRIAVAFNDGSFPVGTWEPLPTQTVSFVPMAFESATVGGVYGSQIFRVVNGSGAPQNIAPWPSTSYEALTGLVGSVTTSSGTVTGISGTASGFTGSLAGDVTGTQSATKVERIQGRAVSLNAPSNGDVLSWNAGASEWRPVSPATGGGGDVMSTRTLNAGTGLTGGGDLSADRTFAVNVGTGANQIPQLDGSGKLNSSVLPSSTLTSSSTAGGDASGTLSALSVVGIRGNAVSSGSFTGAGQVYRWGGSGLVPSFLELGDIRTSAALQVFPTTCTNSQTMVWTSPSNTYACTNISIPWSQVSSTPTTLAGYGITDAASASNVVLKDGQNGALTLGTNDGNSLSLETNNSPRMTITSSGGVGIGNLTPVGNLDVNGPGDAQITISGGSSGNGSFIKLLTARPDLTQDIRGSSAGSGNKGWTISARQEALGTRPGSLELGYFNDVSNSIHLSVSPAGNVGIGTANPSTKLEVAGTIKATAFEGPLTATTNSVGAGSSSAPSLTFTGDPDTGFYNTSSNNTISVATGGAKVFDFSSLGIVSPTTGGAAVSTANGTAAAPTFSFAGDTDTGWFRPADNTLAASTSGTEKIRITSAGSVGIGTATPGGKFEVNDGDRFFFGSLDDSATNNSYDIARLTVSATGASYPELYLRSVDSTATDSSILSGKHLSIATGSPIYDISLGSNGAYVNNSPTKPNHVSRLFIDNGTGNVGVGTVAPGVRFESQSSLTGGPVTSGVSQTYGNLRVSSNATNMALDVGNDGGNSASWLQSVNKTDLSILTGKLLLNPVGGNVGIGTANPGAVLEVNGPLVSASYPFNTSLIDPATAAQDVGGGLSFHGRDGTTATSYAHYAGVRGGKENATAGNYAGYLAFHTRRYTSSYTSERMRVTSAGQVLVGSTTAYQTDGSITPQIQVHGPSATTASLSLTSWLNGSSNPGSLVLGHSKSTTVGTNAIVGSSDALGGIFFNGDDGSGFSRAAYIQVNVDGTPAADSIPGRIGFGTTADGGTIPSERMVISSEGYVGIGVASPTRALHVVTNTAISADTSALFASSTSNNHVGISSPTGYDSILALMEGNTNLWRLTARGADDRFTWRNSAGTEVATILQNGNMGIGVAAPSQKLHIAGNLRVQGSTDCTLGNGSGGTSCSSDERLKMEIRDIEDPLSKILSLRGVDFVWNEKSLSPGRHDIGVIAQDVEKVFPTAVAEDEETGYKRVDYAVLVAPLIQAFKALHAQVKGLWQSSETQSREIASLRSENESQAAEIRSLREKNDEMMKRLERLEKALEKNP